MLHISFSSTAKVIDDEEYFDADDEIEKIDMLLQVERDNLSFQDPQN
jgi:hypothetical protein